MIFFMFWEGNSTGPISLRACSWLLLLALCHSPAICLVLFWGATQLLIARACKGMCISLACAMMQPDLAVAPMQCISGVQQALQLGGLKLTCCCLNINASTMLLTAPLQASSLRHFPSACSTWVYSRELQPVACRQKNLLVGVFGLICGSQCRGRAN